MRVTFREATTKDVPVLFKLAQELMIHNRILNKADKTRYKLLKLVPNIKKLWVRWVTKQITSSNGSVIVAEIKNLKKSKNEIVGYALIYIQDNVKVYSIRKTGYIGDLYITQGYRNKGIATKFKELAFGWFKKKKMKYASIAVHSKNIKAHSIYKKWGFFDYHTEMRRKL
ncbi:MAG: GNAT family N-acetyltransferase [Candidatus Micrarchaeota archaeon]|nr:GNAT family N-acetyltransferase [Candidatus Micrarchaeota archaeon]